jgi:hypothetical protein
MEAGRTGPQAPRLVCCLGGSMGSNRGICFGFGFGFGGLGLLKGFGGGSGSAQSVVVGGGGGAGGGFTGDDDLLVEIGILLAHDR